MQDNVINFYRVSEVPYGVFSNFPFRPIVLGGEVWNSSEIYFQAKKFEGTEHEQIVRAAETSQMAADMGRERSRPLRADWNDEKDMASLPDHATLSVAWAKHVGRPMLVKDYIMLLAVRAKFTQHEDLKQLLISTAESLLVEHTKNDSYWADGGDGTGVNMLGKILMIVRDEINCAAN